MQGLIPAHAGKTLSYPHAHLGMWAHPRSRGENATNRLSQISAGGSSPLTRGKLPPREVAPRHRGLIPAHAGKTGTMPGVGPFLWAHPRSRGENVKRTLVDWTLAGSSPLTRGKPGRGLGSAGCAGLIPAHAGKTMRLSQQGLITRAHPRSRGENESQRSRTRWLRGSSPLTRGKHTRARLSSRVVGLIPAHAGKTDAMQRVNICERAHPRSRGENEAKPSHSGLTTGSSPLTRGKPVRASGSRWPSGLIPAHAGKTGVCVGCWFYGRAHPRSRGENRYGLPTGSRGRGSSPLTRGNETVGRRKDRPNGSSPLTRGKLGLLSVLSV